VSGGEPFARADLLTILERARSRGASLNVLTSGALLDASTVDAVCRIGVQRLGISVDGLEGMHDQLRGMPGLFQQLEAVLQRFAEQRRRPRVFVETTVMGPNLEQLTDMVRWVERRGGAGVVFQVLAPNFGADDRDPAQLTGSPLWVDDHGPLVRVVDELIQMRRAGHRIVNSTAQLESFKDYYLGPTPAAQEGCGAGATHMEIIPNGDVVLCHPLGSIGSVKHDSPRAVWRSPEAARVRQEIASCRRSCYALNCNYQESIMEKAWRYLAFHTGVVQPDLRRFWPG